MDLATIVTLLVAALDAYAISLALTRRLGVEATLAWIFAILALPILGGLSYLMLAGPSIRRTAQRKRARALGVRASAPGAADTPVPAPVPEDALLPSEVSLLRLAANLTDLQPSAGNEVELLAESEQAFVRIGQALRQAQRSIWAESYIIKNDETGQRFMGCLNKVFSYNP